MPADRQFYSPEGGTALDKDNDVFDVTAWRKNGVQERNGHEHQRVFNPKGDELLEAILRQMKEMNFHLQIITGEKHED